MNVKICGLNEPVGLKSAIDAGARYIGFNFYKKSPRYVDLETARSLATIMPDGLCKVALVVDATDKYLDEINAAVPLDMLQLHGNETPERVSEIRSRYGLPVMKALGISDADDLKDIDKYASVADQLLIDAKPPKNSELPGGNGLSFDWKLIANKRWTVPWMLAGGLRADNVATAIRLTGAKQVDVSSGVESGPGIKDPAQIASFIKAAYEAN